MLQTEYSYTNRSYKVGDLIKPIEPHVLESMRVDTEMPIGIFCAYNLDENYTETVRLLTTSDKTTGESILYGITVNDVRYSDTTENSYFYKPKENIVVGRIANVLSVMPKFKIADGTSDVFEAKLYVICGGDDNGALYIADTDPTDTDDVKYIVLSEKFKLRPSENSQQFYLEITA